MLKSKSSYLVPIVGSYSFLLPDIIPFNSQYMYFIVMINLNPFNHDITVNNEVTDIDDPIEIPLLSDYEPSYSLFDLKVNRTQILREAK